MTNPPSKVRVVAVFGSVAAGGPARDRRVSEEIFNAIREQAPVIAKPLLEQGVSAGAITAGEQREFLARLAQPQRTPAPQAPCLGKERGLTVAQRRLFATVYAAIRERAQAIAKPLLDQAVSVGSMTRAQADAISARLMARRVALAL